MMKYLRQFTMLVLVFTGLTFIIGGALLVYDPGGSMMGLSYSYLDETLFNTYLIPGVLVIAVGLGSLLVAVLTYKKVRNYAYYIIAIGVFLILFLIAQMMIIGTYTIVHIIYVLLALLLIALGNLIRNQRHTHHAAKTVVHSPVKKHPHTHRHKH